MKKIVGVIFLIPILMGCRSDGIGVGPVFIDPQPAGSTQQGSINRVASGPAGSSSATGGSGGSGGVATGGTGGSSAGGVAGGGGFGGEIGGVGGDPGFAGGIGGSAGSGGFAGVGGGRVYQKMPPPYPMASYAQEVVSFTQGTGAVPISPDTSKVLGPPQGWGSSQGSGDVLNLGFNGVIVVTFEDYMIFDGPGVDFTVFENAFILNGTNITFAELGIVGVSDDGVNFVEFPCDVSAWPYPGCAGVQPVYANTDFDPIDPLDPAVSGGDLFDLADVELQTARYIRIRDIIFPPPSIIRINGFDLDAVAIVNGTLP